jgi:probable HAF family extracellular repeat protein
MKPSGFWSITLMSVIFVLVLVPAFTTQQSRAAIPPYVVTDLGILGSVQSAHAFDINADGAVVGLAGNRPFLWQDGVMTDLTTVTGNRGQALAINNNGQIAGSSTITPTSAAHPVVWSGGAMIDLTPNAAPNEGGAANGINDAGHVVGTINYSTGFLWQNGILTTLGTLGGPGTFANDINNAGQVVGASYSTVVTQLGPMQHAFLWHNGVMSDLGLLDGDEDSGASAINTAGQIVGSSGRTDPETYETTYRSFIYENGEMRALPVPSWDSYAADINDLGRVVGTMRAAGGMSKWHAYIYADGVAKDLNTLIPADAGLHLLYAYAINNAGQIVGVAYDSQAHYHAYLLTPVASGTPVANVNDASVIEGHSGVKEVTFTVTLSQPASAPVTISYSTANATATAGSDYHFAAGTITFDVGQTVATISVLIDGDHVGEVNETFQMNLSGAPDGIVIADSQGTGTIVDDEPRISINDVSKNEGNNGTSPFTFTVALTSASAVPISTAFATADGSAKSPEDYEVKSGTITFAVGETSKTISVLVKGDKKREAQEVFYVNLSSAGGGFILDSQGTGVIRNDDH